MRTFYNPDRLILCGSDSYIRHLDILSRWWEPFAPVALWDSPLAYWEASTR